MYLVMMETKSNGWVQDKFMGSRAQCNAYIESGWGSSVELRSFRRNGKTAYNAYDTSNNQLVFIVWIERA